MSKANSLERQMLDLINAERSQRGLDPLQLELRLNDAAEDHSRWILNTDRFSHTGAGGSSPRERMEDANFRFSGSNLSAENIAWQSVRGASGLADDVVNLHEALMNSSGHRANILNPNAEVIGIGIERGNFDGWDAIVVTQNFARTSAPVQIDNGGSNTPAPTPPAPTPPPPPPPREDDQHLNGTGGDNALVGDTGHDTLNGNGGDDTLRGDGGNDRLNGGSGADKLIGGDGKDNVAGGSGNDVIKGNNGRDNLQGGDGRDKLIGGKQADVLDGGSGNDLLKGGKNNDRFVFSNDHGKDKIKDFNAASSGEKIDLRDVDGFDSFRDVKQAATQLNNHVRIDTGEDSWITLLNTQLAQLDSGDFLV